MSENTAVAETDDDFDDEPAGGKGTADKAAEKLLPQSEVDRIVADRVARERAKYADYNQLKQRAKAAMSDQEKALEEAEQRGRAAALSANGPRLAEYALRAHAAGKVSPDALSGFLEFADMSRFVTEDGEPNTKAIEAAVKKLSSAGPNGNGGSTNFDGGARGNAEKPAGMNDLIRRQAGY